MSQMETLGIPNFKRPLLVFVIECRTFSFATGSSSLVPSSFTGVHWPPGEIRILQKCRKITIKTKLGGERMSNSRGTTVKGLTMNKQMQDTSSLKMKWNVEREF